MSSKARMQMKVFGQDGGTSEFGQIGSNAASPPGTTTKDIENIQSLSQYLDGLYAITASAGEPPRIQDINALYYLITYQMSYLFQLGIPEWINDSDEASRYYAGRSIVQRSGAIYIALLGDDSTNINIQKDPLTETTWWKVLLPSTTQATLSTTQTYTPVNGINYHLILDTSLGSTTTTLEDGLFIGQKITLECDGSGLAYYKGTGIYDGASSLGTPLSDGKSITLTWNGSKWIYGNIKTAEWVSGAYHITQHSGGDMEYSVDIATTAVSSASRNVPYSLPVPYADTSYSGTAVLEGIIGSGAFSLYSFEKTGASTGTFNFIESNGSPQSGTLDAQISLWGGKY